MKKVLLIAISPFLVLSLYFFTPSKDKARKPVKGPFDTYLVRDTIFMDAAECTNEQYRLFIDGMKKKYADIDPWIYKKELPDTLVWRTYGSYNDEQVSGYFSHPAYDDFPVVGVSFQQALDYCKWKTEELRELVKSPAYVKQMHFPEKIEDLYFRLPTVKEWEEAAYGGLDTALHPFGYEFLDDTMHIDKVRVKQEYDGVVGMNYGEEPLLAYCYLPNTYGFYCMIGNVAEMTSVKGVCKGGSFRNYLDQCHVRDSIRYDAPSNWLGFRCVCVVRYKAGYDQVTGKKKK
jgi:formylglycine-generating enzyme required for sulfatase activity